ncbi:hypothetical protein SAMN06297422_10441 [Lachnospiraceae bacterium]|nr:hypothetical protein SAMN06297422_10441 [Lachnospiraceae bacterium]
MKYILIILAVFIVLIMILFLESARELNKLKVTEYIIDKNVPSELKGKSIVFMSDYHEAQEGKLDKRIIDLIRDIDPICILAGGDMVNSNEDPADKHPSQKLLNKLASEYKVYYSYGNHEKRLVLDYHEVGADWKKYLKRLDGSIKILSNKSIKLFDNTYIYGLDIPIEKYGRINHPDLSVEEINEMIGKKNEDSYVILLAHAPDFFDGYRSWGADLVLSGHFHGGIIRLPLLGGLISPRLRVFPKYDYGRYMEDRSEMIVTNGIGQHSIKVRFNNIPEIVVLRFK